MPTLEQVTEDCKKQFIENKKLFPTFHLIDNTDKVVDQHSVDPSKVSFFKFLYATLKKINETNSSKLIFSFECAILTRVLRDEQEDGKTYSEYEDNDLPEFIKNINGKDVILTQLIDKNGTNELLINQICRHGDIIDYIHMDIPKELEFKDFIFSKIFELAEESKTKAWWELNW